MENLKDMSEILAKRVKELCNEKGLQLKELATIIQVKPESLSRTLNGNPQLSSLENIAKALNVGVADLFYDRTERHIITSAKTTPNSLTSIIVYNDKKYIANSLDELIKQFSSIINDC